MWNPLLPLLTSEFKVITIDMPGFGESPLQGDTTTMEAMATGVPCVATDVGDCADIIGDTGLIVPRRDHEALVGALKKMLEMPASERKVLGIAARARIAERYSLEAIVHEYAAVYEELAMQSKGTN